LFKLAEQFTSKQQNMYNISTCKSFTSKNITVELLGEPDKELAVLWNRIVVAILYSQRDAELIFSNYCMRAMYYNFFR